MNESGLEHLRQMLALHERAAYLAKTTDEKRAARSCASDYAHRISRAMERQP